jgi:hypothetical protein
MSDCGASGVSPAGDELGALQSFQKLPTLKKLSNQNESPRIKMSGAGVPI